MPLIVIIGAQWGDEGKGRITDRLAAQAQITARYSGGDNAGHTVTVGERIFKLHLLPSGVIQPGVVGVMGNGMAVNPARLLAEMEKLAGLGIDLSPERVKLSHAAHLITPAHIALDVAEEARRGGEKIGTTGRGIGPAYYDKTARRGLRAESMRQPEAFGDLVLAQVQAANRLLERVYERPPQDATQIAAEYAEYARRLGPYVADTSLYLDEALSAGKTVLAEGAQGTLLDLDHGPYPFVSSPSASIGGVFTGLGIRPQYLTRVVGVTKVFQTRVGAGPFPTETFGVTAGRLRGSGANPWDEFGTTTGRPRRCGWLDLVLLRYAVRVNGISELALTKLDVLSGLDPLRLCVAYEADGERFSELPLGPADLSPFRAVYEERPGWEQDVRAARKLSDLPPAAQEYLRRVQGLSGAPVSLVSVGPERDQIVELPPV
ncbi:MAG: adenylosuccinate synthase [Chloroflexi bacterium]|nr:adenylosuccinate synthase [Chloroflexota bacterium]